MKINLFDRFQGGERPAAIPVHLQARGRTCAQRLYIHIYIYICVCAHTSIPIHIYTDIHIYMYIYIYMYLYNGIYSCLKQLCIIAGVEELQVSTRAEQDKLCEHRAFAMLTYEYVYC